MEQRTKYQVSLRGASTKEISRDALIEKVFQEREHRHYARRASAAVLFIQRVWRRYKVTKEAAFLLQEEWEQLVNNSEGIMTRQIISEKILRPFLFFISCLSTRVHKVQNREIVCAKKCFKILLESMNSSGMQVWLKSLILDNKNYGGRFIHESENNFCSHAMGTSEEKRIWIYQSQKLISLCIFFLSQYAESRANDQEIVALTSLAMRLAVVLTDTKSWKNITDRNQDAAVAVKNLIRFMGSAESGLYISIRQYMNRLNVHLTLQNCVQTNDEFLIIASAITLALRPFHLTAFDLNLPDSWEGRFAAEQFCLLVLTVPWFMHRLPAVLLPAVKHRSILLPCLWTILVSKDKVLQEMSKVDQPSVSSSSELAPSVGWVLANIISLVTGSESNSIDPGWFQQGFDYALYVRATLALAKNFLTVLRDVRCCQKFNQNQYNLGLPETLSDLSAAAGPESETGPKSLTLPYRDMFRPVFQQSHLSNLLSLVNKITPIATVTAPPIRLEYLRNVEMVDIVYFYSYMLQILSFLNPMVGSLPILNLLSFTPGFLVDIWQVLESFLFPVDGGNAEDKSSCASKISQNKKNRTLVKKQKQTSKDEAHKWVAAFHKFTSKPPAGGDYIDARSDEESSNEWDVISLGLGPEGVSKDTLCLLYLFSATYSHLLLILDDIEFYEKQVPFTLEQQRRISSVLNTLVYNGLSHGIRKQNKLILDSAIKCLHLMYERDCRHQFCSSDLWLSPARKSRPPVAVAARTHEVLSANQISDDSLTVPATNSVITTMPHVFPFEERVEMFREFVRMDKVSRKMAGEISEPGSRAVEIVVRRSHIVEDGFRQLNSLGPKLKSFIHVSFVSECDLLEAGLDCGGLSKEFLTDIAKAAFAPEYGLFSQTSTSDRLLIPNTSARYLENGIQMIEFLGRIVGKALYEGILLDYSFSHIFVQKLLGRYSFLDELSTLDPELYKNLMYVKHCTCDVKELSLDFTVTEESFGKWRVIDLIHGGKNIPVTNDNKMQYVHAIADYKLNRQILPFSNAFYRGLTDLVSPSWLKLFNANEFNQLLSGGKYDIDVEDLRNNTRYTGGYTEGSRTIKIFWEVMEEFEPKERCMLLKFVTSCSQAPLLGFKHLQPTFTIHKITCDVPIWASIGGQDVDRLPSASTCYNTLKLPTYKRPSTLRAKLLYAINSNSGFELS